MKRLALTGIFLAAFAVTALSMVPLRLALTWSRVDVQGLSARSVSGSIWNGRLDQAQFRDHSVGDVRVSLDPLALIRGIERVSLTSKRGDAKLLLGAAHGIEDADVEVEFAQLALAMPGSLKLTKAALVFQNGRCVKAQGALTSDVFKSQWNGPEIAGTWSCAGDAATTNLTGHTADIDIDLALRLEADGRYRLQSSVASANPAIRAQLGLAGFTGHEDRFIRTDEGMLGT